MPDHYLTLVRCGADTLLKDNEGTSLFTIISTIGTEHHLRELNALLAIAPNERIHYTPKLIDYFITGIGIEELIQDLTHRDLTKEEIYYLARYPRGKEQVIQFIKTLPVVKQKEVVELCLTPGSALNQFFTVRRGWFLTKNRRGSLAELVKMNTILQQKEPHLDEASHSDEPMGHDALESRN